MSLYTWTGLNGQEDAIASGRLSAQIAVNIPGLETLSMAAKRDAALAECVAELGGTSPATFPSLTLTDAASKIIPGATSLSLRNHADGADNLIITDAGLATFRSNIGIGGGPGLTNAGLYGPLSLSGNTDMFGIYLDVSYNHTSISNATGFRVAVSTAAAAFTAGSLRGIHIQLGTKGAGSTITNYVGLEIDTPGLASTTNYGIKIGNISVSATTNNGLTIGTVSGGATNNYGILIGNVTGTGAFAIKTGTGPVSFGDTLTVAGLATFQTNNGVDFINQTTGAGVGLGTLTNAPSAGDPSFWLRIKIGGANRFIPCWT